MRNYSRHISIKRISNFIILCLVVLSSQLLANDVHETDIHILADQYSLEFLIITKQIRLYYDLLDFGEDVLRKHSDLKALTPLELDKFYNIIKVN